MHDTEVEKEGYAYRVRIAYWNNIRTVIYAMDGDNIALNTWYNKLSIKEQQFVEDFIVRGYFEIPKPFDKHLLKNDRISILRNELSLRFIVLKMKEAYEKHFTNKTDGMNEWIPKEEARMIARRHIQTTFEFFLSDTADNKEQWYLSLRPEQQSSAKNAVQWYLSLSQKQQSSVDDIIVSDYVNEDDLHEDKIPQFIVESIEEEIVRRYIHTTIESFHDTDNRNNAVHQWYLLLDSKRQNLVDDIIVGDYFKSKQNHDDLLKDNEFIVKSIRPIIKAHDAGKASGREAFSRISSN